MKLDKYNEYMFEKLLENVKVNSLPFVMSIRLIDLLTPMYTSYCKNIIKFE